MFLARLVVIVGMRLRRSAVLQQRVPRNSKPFRAGDDVGYVASVEAYGHDPTIFRLENKVTIGLGVGFEVLARLNSYRQPFSDVDAVVAQSDWGNVSFTRFQSRYSGLVNPDGAF